MTAEPSILVRKLKPQDMFLIFASDGLWEHLSDEAAVDVVLKNPRTVRPFLPNSPSFFLFIGFESNPSICCIRFLKLHVCYVIWTYEFISHNILDKYLDVRAHFFFLSIFCKLPPAHSLEYSYSHPCCAHGKQRVDFT